MTKFALIFLTGCIGLKDPSSVESQVVDRALAECVAQADTVDEAAIRDVCRVADVMLPWVRKLLSAKKAGLQKMGAKVCH